MKNFTQWGIGVEVRLGRQLLRIRISLVGSLWWPRRKLKSHYHFGQSGSRENILVKFERKKQSIKEWNLELATDFLVWPCYHLSICQMVFFFFSPSFLYSVLEDLKLGLFIPKSFKQTHVIYVLLDLYQNILLVIK